MGCCCGRICPQLPLSNMMLNLAFTSCPRRRQRKERTRLFCNSHYLSNQHAIATQLSSSRSSARVPELVQLRLAVASILSIHILYTQIIRTIVSTWERVASQHSSPIALVFILWALNWLELSNHGEPPLFSAQ